MKATLKNDLKTGIIHEYYDNAQLKYENIYVDGKRNGKSKEYYKNGNISFEGEYFNGFKKG